ncbi:MAG: ABC transporter permease [Hyphomicrobiales bacterium]
MRLDIEPRAEISARAQILSPVIAVLIAVAIGGLIVLALGKSPVQALFVYFIDPLSQSWTLQELAIKGTPLVLIASGLIYCFRANLWNIGAEGQFTAGAIMGSILPLATHGSEAGPWVIVLSLLMGTVGGALYALIPALLKIWFKVSEILTSLMLVYVAQLGLDYLVRGPWRDPKGFNFPQSAVFEPGATLPSLVSDGRLHAGIILALIAVGVSWFVFTRTLFGFGIRVSGEAPKAARFAGFDAKRMVIFAFLISGGLAGLAGIVEVTGQIGQLQPSISPGYGFTAITVAFLGRLHPVGLVLGAFIVSLTVIGGESAQIAMKLPLDLTTVFQGVLLMCVLAANCFASYRVRIVSGGAR